MFADGLADAAMENGETAVLLAFADAAELGLATTFAVLNLAADSRTRAA